MTDELSIQQRPSAVPYFLVGGAAGTGAGFLVNKYGTKASTPEELIAEANAKDIAEFSGTQKASMEGLKGKLAEVQKLEEELKVISEGSSPEIDAARRKVEAAKTEIQNEIAKLQKAENLRVGAGGKSVTSVEFTNPKELTGTRDVLNEYTKRYEEYQSALKEAEANVDRSKVESLEKEINKRLGNISKHSGTKLEKVKLGKEVKEIEHLAADAFPFVESGKDAGRINAYMKEHGIKSEGKAIKEINAGINAQRKAMVEEILGERQVIEIVDKKTGKVKGKRTTYANVERLNSAKVARENGFKNFDNVAKNIGLNHNSPELKNIANIESEIAALKKKEATMVPKNYQTEMKKLEQKLELAHKLERINTSYERSVQRVMNSVSRVQTLNQKVENAVHQKVQKQLGKLQSFVNKHPELDGAMITHEAKEGVAETAKTITEADIAEGFKENLKKAQESLDAAVKKGGKVDAAAKAAKEAEVATAKNSAKEYATKIAKDFKSPLLKQKWIAPVAGAVLLGLGALSLRPSNKS